MSTSSEHNTKSSTLMQATQELVNLLSPLESENRKRVVQAAFVLLGETTPILKGAEQRSDSEEEKDIGLSVSSKAKLWMKQNGISEQGLAQVFHLEDGKVSFIAGEVPGKNAKEKALNSYVISGLMAFLVSGEPKFGDQQARKLCTDAGCYDSTNHVRYLKDKGNSFTGSKDSGWVLTAPGLKAGAKIVQELSASK